MSPMTAYLRCWTPLMFSNSASTTSRMMRPKNAITPTTVPKLHALASPLYRQRSLSQPWLEMQPNTITENSCAEPKQHVDTDTGVQTLARAKLLTTKLLIQPYGYQRPSKWLIRWLTDFHRLIFTDCQLFKIGVLAAKSKLIFFCDKRARNQKIKAVNSNTELRCSTA